jgi:hypothetical protein
MTRANLGIVLHQILERAKLENRRARFKRYYYHHLEEMRARKIRYYEENKEIIKVKNQEYYRRKMSGSGIPVLTVEEAIA